jgi:hypothetical protein
LGFQTQCGSDCFYFHDYFAELHQQSWSKTLRFYKRFSRLSKFIVGRFDLFGWLASKRGDGNFGQCLDVTTVKRFVVAYKRNGFDIWNFGSISRFDVSSVALGKGDFIAGEIKKNVMWD